MFISPVLALIGKGSSKSPTRIGTGRKMPSYLQDTPVGRTARPQSGQAVQLPLFAALDTPSPDASSAEQPAYALPTGWNTKDKCQLLDVSNNNLRVTYQGKPAACTRAGLGTLEIVCCSS